MLTRILITRVLRRVLPAQEGGPLQPQSAANGVFWFLVLVTVIISLSLLAPSLLSNVPAHVIGFLPKLGTALVMLWLAALAAGTITDVGIASITVADRDGSLVEIPHRWLLDRPVRRSGL